MESVTTLIACPHCKNLVLLEVKYQDLSKPVLTGCYVEREPGIQGCGKQFLVLPFPKLDCRIFKIAEFSG